MKIKFDNGTLFINKNFYVYKNTEVKFENFDDLFQKKQFDFIKEDPEKLAWLIPKPRPSIFALIILLLINENQVSFFKYNINEYRKLINNNIITEDIDYNYIKRFSNNIKFITNDSRWNIEFLNYSDIKNSHVTCSINSSKFAYITYYDGRYFLGLLALIRSIRRFSNIKIIVLTTDKIIPDILYNIYNIEIKTIATIKNTNIHGQKRFINTYNKLAIFSILNYKKLIYIDSDCILLKNIDFLFEINEEIVACPDWGLEYKQFFNSGVIIFTPSHKILEKITNGIEKNIVSYDGGDQGFLNKVLNIKFLPPEFNTLKRTYEKRPWVFDEENIYILHFVGVKPWDPLDYDPKYESIYYLWISILEKEDLIYLYKYNKIYTVRRIEKYNKKINSLESKINKIESDAKNYSLFSNFLIKLKNIWR